MNVANFVISQNVNPEADSAMQTRLEVLSKNNAVLGVPMHEKTVVVDGGLAHGETSRLNRRQWGECLCGWYRPRFL